MDPMWVTLLHVLEWPLAIICGYAIAKTARARGLPVWLAYGATLTIGVAIGFLCSLLPAGNERPWRGLMIWAAWSAFGTVQGSRRERDTAAGPLTLLKLSDRNR